MNNVYIEFLKKSFQQRFVYRANTLINFLGALFGLMIEISVWAALLSHNSVKGISFPDMVNYVIINTIVATHTSSGIANFISDKIMNGNIAVDFIRPVNFKYYVIANQLGENLYWTVFRSLPVCLFAVAFLGFQLPNQLFYFILFMISIINGVIILYYIHFILGLQTFWLKTSHYANWIFRASFTLFGGAFVPLWFYPDLLYNISDYLPFRLISFDPISIYLGKVSFSTSYKIIALQYIWIFFLFVLERYVWKMARSKVIVQGG